MVKLCNFLMKNFIYIHLYSLSVVSERNCGTANTLLFELHRIFHEEIRRNFYFTITPPIFRNIILKFTLFLWISFFLYLFTLFGLRKTYLSMATHAHHKAVSWNFYGFHTGISRIPYLDSRTTLLHFMTYTLIAVVLYPVYLLN